jgi:Cu2+-exporting ATPase
VVVGSPAFVHARAAAAAPPGVPLDDACTPVLVAVDGVVVARAGLGDPLREGTRAALDAMRAAGWHIAILSGDDPRVVASTARALGIPAEDCRGGATPEEKRAVVEAAARSGPVVMVGDGVNDAAAIAAATVGIGVRGGAEACLAAADVFLARAGLGPLLELQTGARRTVGLIRLGIGFSLCYNLVGAALAITGVMDPLIAAIVMPLSSLTVVLAAWRGRTFTGAAA